MTKLPFPAVPGDSLYSSAENAELEADSRRAIDNKQQREQERNVDLNDMANFIGLKEVDLFNVTLTLCVSELEHVCKHEYNKSPPLGLNGRDAHCRFEP